MKIFSWILFFVFNYIGVSLVLASGLRIFISFEIFLILNLYLLNTINQRNQIFGIYTFVGWIIYNSMGLLRLSYMNVVDKDDLILRDYWLVIICSILIYVGINKGNRLSFSSKESLSDDRLLKFGVFFITSIVYLLIKLYEIKMAGGLYAFIYASYGYKVDSSIMTFFSLFGGIFGFSVFFSYPYIFIKGFNIRKLYAICFLSFYVIMTVFTGASLGVFNILISIWAYLYFRHKNSYFRYKLKIGLAIIVIIGSVSAILIRFNRDNNSEFSYDVLKNTTSLVLETSTFDQITNMDMVFEKLEPQYGLGQTIYPFVSFLPHNIFTWKPVELSRIITRNIKDIDNNENLGFVPSPMGEFYYDFGIWGILVGMIYVGYIIGALDRFVFCQNDTVFRTIIITIIGTYLPILGGWYTGMGIRLVRAALFLLLYNFLSKFSTLKK